MVKFLSDITAPERRAIDSSADLCANKRPIGLWCFEQVADWLVASRAIDFQPSQQNRNNAFEQ